MGSRVRVPSRPLSFLKMPFVKKGIFFVYNLSLFFMFYVYIIYSKTFDIYYKGFSEDVAQRIIYHNENRSKYTSNKGPWELVYFGA